MADDETMSHRPPEPEQRIRIDIFHHFPEGIPLSVTEAITAQLTVLGQNTPPSPAVATSAVLTLKGAKMPGQITVDTTNETVTLSFVDDHGDTDAAAPAGAVVVFASDNPAVATVALDASVPFQADVTPVAEGTANISATLTDASGNPLTEADGSTPFPAPDSVEVTVAPGSAVGDALTLSV
jgi:hypothetical protein